MREANAVVGKLQTLVDVHFTPRPNAAVAVLVGGEVLYDGLNRIGALGGIGEGNKPPRAYTTICQRGTVLHETVKVRMGDVAPELAEFRLSRPGVLAGIRTFERACRMIRKCKPEPCRIRPR